MRPNRSQQSINTAEIESNAADVFKLVTGIAATTPDAASDPSQGHGNDEPCRLTTFADMVNLDE